MFTKSKTNDKTFLRSVFINLVLVTTVSAFSGIVIGLIDSYCISRFIGDSGLAAISLTSPLNQIIYGISCIFAVGSELLITKFLARGESEDANRSFISNLAFLLVIGVIFFSIVFFASLPISKLLSLGRTSNEVVKLTSAYLKGFSVGIPFLFLNEIFFALSYLDGDKKRPTISVFILFATNIALDFLFATYFQDKMFGIGLASALSYLLSSLFLFTHFLSKKSEIRLGKHGFEFKHIKNSFVNGIPVGIKNLSSTLRLYLINLIILTVSSLDKSVNSDLIIAAHYVEDTVTDLFNSVIAGIISATIMLSNVFYNEEDEKSLNELVHEIIKFVLIVGGAITIIYFFTAPYLAPIWSKDKVVISEAIYSMRAKSLSTIFIMFCSAIVSFHQGTKNHLLANITSLTKSFALPVVFTLVFGFAFGVKGIWVGAPIGYALFVIIYLMFSFIKNKRVKLDVRTLFFLRRDFGFKEEEMYEKTIYSIEDVYSIQNDVIKLCEKFNVDEVRKQNLANCAEELGNLVVMSGFNKNINKAKPYCSIKVLYKKAKDLLIIRTRDNCEKFDIKVKIKEIKEGKSDDIALNCSIKMILHMAKDIDYSQILKTNNMIIKI